MAIYSEASWEPLPENETQARIEPDQIILHTAVDHPGPTNLRNYFARSDIRLESHFWIPNDGSIVQMMSTTRRADANKDANGRAISIETEDDGDPEGNKWTPAQVASIVRLLDWLCETHGIPKTIMNAWTDPGIGWHSMWGFRDGVNLTGGYLVNPWTGVRGKTCPGKTRIQQIFNEIMPTLNQSSADPVAPWEYIANASPQVRSAHVAAWQTRLGVWGYKVTVDGLVGPQTTGSHRAWSKKFAVNQLDRPNIYHWKLLAKDPKKAGEAAEQRAAQVAIERDGIDDVEKLRLQLKASMDLNSEYEAQIARALAALR